MFIQLWYSRKQKVKWQWMAAENRQFSSFAKKKIITDWLKIYAELLLKEYEEQNQSWFVVKEITKVKLICSKGNYKNKIAIAMLIWNKDLINLQD